MPPICVMASRCLMPKAGRRQYDLHDHLRSGPDEKSRPFFEGVREESVHGLTGPARAPRFITHHSSMPRSPPAEEALRECASAHSGREQSVEKRVSNQ